MDVIIVCHTEFGFVDDKTIIYDKGAKSGVSLGVANSIKLAEKYSAKITFAVCPEVVDYFPKNTSHEIGLHIHPGWREFASNKFTYFVGDEYLKNNCKQSLDSVALRDFSFEEQLGMITSGKEYIQSKLGKEPKIFVAGVLSENNDTIKALVAAGMTHDCSASSPNKNENIDWSRLPRITMPYHPNKSDYQKKGDLPILMVPISQFFHKGSATPELISKVGRSWLKACFLEYYNQGVPLFHFIFHSPSMTDNYFISAVDDFLAFVSKHKNIHFKFASEIKEYPNKIFKTNMVPYLMNVNKEIIATGIKKCLGKINNPKNLLTKQ